MSPRALIIGLLLLVVSAAYFPLFHADFTNYDDPATITFNPAFNPPTVRKLLPIWAEWGARAPLGLYIPVTYSVWGLFAAAAYSPTADEFGSHLNPWVFHSGNVLLHATACLLTFILLRQLLKTDWPAAGGALLFAVHPMQVEAVAWASGSKDLLCGVLSLAAVCLYLQTAQANRKKTMLRSAVFLLVFLAMLAKPTAIITPLLAGIVDATFLRRSWKAILTDLWPLLTLIPLCAAWAHAAQPATDVAVAPIWARPLLAGDSLWFYFYKLILPIDLAVDYGRKPLLIFAMRSLWITASTGIILIFSGLMVLRRRLRWLAAALWFVTGLAPVLGFLPFTFQQYSGVADHYLYLSMFGVALAAGLSLQSTNSFWVAAYGGLILTLSFVTHHQAAHWQHETHLWHHCVTVNPQSLLARTNFGGALYRVHRLVEAEQQFMAAVEIDPSDLDAQENLALIFLATGRPAQAIECLQRELQLSAKVPPALRPKLDGPYVLLGRAYMALNDPLKARAALSSALRENPGSAEAAKQLSIAAAHTSTTLPF